MIPRRSRGPLPPHQAAGVPSGGGISATPCVLSPEQQGHHPGPWTNVIHAWHLQYFEAYLREVEKRAANICQIVPLKETQLKQNFLEVGGRIINIYIYQSEYRGKDDPCLNHTH